MSSSCCCCLIATCWQLPVHHQLTDLLYPIVEWCHPTPSHLLQSFPASECFLIVSYFAGQKYWISFNISPSKIIQRLISHTSHLQSQGTLKNLLDTTVQKHQFFQLEFLYSPAPIHTGKPRTTECLLSRFSHKLLPRQNIYFNFVMRHICIVRHQIKTTHLFAIVFPWSNVGLPQNLLFTFHQKMSVL